MTGTVTGTVTDTTSATALDRLVGPGLTLGVELPLDNDFSAGRQMSRRPGEVFGIPRLDRHRERAQLADELGFRAIWLRDVPLWLPETFGDAGGVFDPFPYLGFLAGVTRRTLLATAAIVLPLRHPLHVAKMAATVDRLSGGRLVLGVASGDRPVEYPQFGVDFAARGEIYRQAVAELRSVWRDAAESPDTDAKVLPAPVAGTIPVLAVGRSRQTTAWVAEHLDGYVTYHRPAPLMRPVVEDWRAALPGDADKPVVTTMLVDLTADPDEELVPIRLGARTGRHGLVRYLRALEAAGVAHVALNLRPSERPVEEVLREIAEHVLPRFPAPSQSSRAKQRDDATSR